VSRFVVETAVALKWFIPEKDSSFAARLLDGGCELLAPDTLFSETGKVLTVKAQLGECSREEGIQVMEAIRSTPVWIHPSDPLLEPAFLFSSDMGRPLGDGLNMALAVASDCRLVTANRVFYEDVQDTPFARYIKWIGDLR
jgi:predicted nucleic acid-binding protein